MQGARTPTEIVPSEGLGVLGGELSTLKESHCFLVKRLGHDTAGSVKEPVGRLRAVPGMHVIRRVTEPQLKGSPGGGEVFKH